jgi:hypothetical protein
MSWQIIFLCSLVIFGWNSAISRASDDKERSFSHESFMSLDLSEIEIHSDQENSDELSETEDSEESQDRYIHASLDEQCCLNPEQLIVENYLNLKRLYDMVQQPMLCSQDVMFFLEAKVFFIIYGKDIFNYLLAECSTENPYTYQQIVENIYKEIDGLFTNPNGAFKNGNPFSPSSSKHNYLYKLASKYATCKRSNHT